ncbi:SpaH/EbpB family LPXTG-anchored major pilin [Corynebacterium sphenisci]|uniref:SpaH/EbpB family LPXTG-anchored major pilin n=1 Tax=Corynebacterium sphenisci TaxID=191493 RepID=UPI0026DF6EFE|nr:SpaH/EbpB family LPXTG-anchored major pilin [Corynebacterium sphenisci]MDO5730967.1 SpaH/EbpB family LPXTG-anchored major pilin [Corynebacterium sphenisci]
MHTDRRFIRPAATAAILGLALTTGVFAAPVTLDLTPAAAAVEQAATIDFTRTGSITIHKRAGDDTETRADGTEMDGVPGEPLDGVEYKLTLVQGYKTSADVAKGQRMTLEEAQAATGGAVSTGTTGPGGVVTFDNLPLGRYLVEEVSAPAGHVPGGPFLVSVPMTAPERTGWNYDVHVYPKNTVNAAEKAVVDAGKHTGDEITYTITSDIPTPAEGGLAKYEIVDDYDENMVTVDPATITAALDDGTALTPGEHFTAEAGADGKVTVAFTAAGLTKLSEKADARVVTTIPATVLAIDGGETVAEGEGTGGVVVPNTAQVIANEGGGSADGVTETNTVETFFGKLLVEKTNDAGEALDGAKFELYDCANKDELGDKISVAGQDTWTTVDGQASINALHVTDYADDAPAGPAKYCLVEVEAPEGYELLAEPVEVEFTREALGASEGEGSADDAVTLVKKITNVGTTQPSLPLTGGMGIGILAALGALIIGAGVWLAKRNGTKA